MALVEETMRQREAEQQELNERRLEHLWSVQDSTHISPHTSSCSRQTIPIVLFGQQS